MGTSPGPQASVTVLPAAAAGAGSPKKATAIAHRRRCRTGRADHQGENVGGKPLGTPSHNPQAMKAPISARNRQHRRFQRHRNRNAETA